MHDALSFHAQNMFKVAKINLDSVRIFARIYFRINPEIISRGAIILDATNGVVFWFLWYFNFCVKTQRVILPDLFILPSHVLAKGPVL